MLDIYECAWASSDISVDDVQRDAFIKRLSLRSTSFSCPVNYKGGFIASTGVSLSTFFR